MSISFFIGIDIGTQGARVVLLDEKGKQVAVKEEVFPLSDNSREQQSPAIWWDCCEKLIPALLDGARRDISLKKIKAIAVTSTSGTIIPLGYDFNPIHPAIMYSDPRSGEEAKFCKEIARREIDHGYTAYNASSGLPKMKWFLNQFPDKTDQLLHFIHASDFITGRLCGEYGTTDHTNALKSGYDLHNDKWPDYISSQIGIHKEWLQVVKPSGTPLRPLLPQLAASWNLSGDVMVTTGMTDGCASQVASGAMSPGQWNTTIGTTLVVKGVTKKEVTDPTGAIYNHRHPEGYWMPGGASNTGADWVSRLFAGEDLQALGEAASKRLPAKSLAWPLMQSGERFPFFSPGAKGFWPEGDRVEQFTSCMEGVAFIERYAYERISSLSGEKIERIYSAGGASHSDTWLRIRANVLNRPVCKMKNVSGAAGAAILAASKTHYKSLQESASKMVEAAMTCEPDPDLVNLYDQKYILFIEELKKREILD